MSGFITRAAGIILLGAAALAQTPAPSFSRGPHIILGRVVDADSGRPIGHAIVTLRGFADPILSYGDPGTPARRSVMATAEGQFVFRDLPIGRYAVVVHAPGHVDIDYPPYRVDLDDGDGPAELTVRLTKFGAIGGRVADERGDPIAGLPVVALRRMTTSAGFTFQRTIPPATTDDRGVYRLAAVPPGTYVVAVVSSTRSMPAALAAALDAVASNPRGFADLRRQLTRGGASFDVRDGDGYRTGDTVLQRTGAALPVSPDGRPLAYAHTYHPQAATPDDATALTIGSGESRDGVDVSLRLMPASRVSGVVTGPEGPLANISVNLLSRGIDTLDYERVGVASAVTDARGAFAFVAVAQGAYRLQAHLLDGDELSGTGLSLWADQPLVVGDDDVPLVDVTMRPGIRVSGRVVFEGAPGDLPPVERASIVLQPAGATFWRTFPTVVQPDGTFATIGDPRGRYLVNAWALGWRVRSTSIGGRNTGEDPIALTDRDVSNVVITMTQSVTRIEGTVMTATGEPEPNASVIVFPADTAAWRDVTLLSRRTRHVRTTTDGRFDVAGLTPGEYHVAAAAAISVEDWWDPDLLAALAGSATRATLGDGQTLNLTLTTAVVRRR